MQEISEPHIRIHIRTTVNVMDSTNNFNLPLPCDEDEDQYACTAVVDPSILFSPQPSIIYVNGVVDIIMHPVYNIPSPFMRFFDDSGAVFDHRQTESICSSHRSSRCSGPSELLGGDHRYHEFGRVILDNHPFFGTPFYSLHVCNASQLLSASASLNHDRDIDIDIENRAVVTTVAERPMSHSDLMVALNWLSLFGPHIGLPFSPSIYSQILSNM